MSDKKKTVLIVDDEPDSVEYVKAIVSEAGDFDILSAPGGEVGLEKARSLLPDLIILDVMMPKKDGFRVFNDLRGEPTTQDIPVIMLTGVSEQTGMKFSGEAMGEYFWRSRRSSLTNRLILANFRTSSTEFSLIECQLSCAQKFSVRVDAGLCSY